MIACTSRSLLAILLTAVLVSQTAFFAFPHTAYADAWAGTAAGRASVPTADFWTQIKTTITSVAAVALEVNQYVLQPLAFVQSVGLLKAMTAGVIAFVIGAANGTGVPQFAQDLQGSLQKVGDIQAQSFFLQFGRNSNSPFAGAITSSLRSDYLQQTSLAGFWAANKCTLTKSSPNINAFLSGNWSQGGTKAWLSLTTQPQNNPYTLYQSSQSQLASVVASAQATRQQVLSWGQGFMSWCGATEEGGSGAVPEVIQACMDDGGSQESCRCEANGGQWSLSENKCSNVGGGVNPGDACVNSDGTPGKIKTPGTTIKATLDKVSGSIQDKVVQMGSLAKEINGVMQNVAIVMQTVQLAQNLLGGRGSGGLVGYASSPAAAGDRGAFLGVTTDTVYQGNAAIQQSAADAKESSVDMFATAWTSIRGSAQNAALALSRLNASCAPQSLAAQTALASQVAPVLARADTAATLVATARALIAKVRSEQNLSTDAGRAAYLSDLQKLQDISPTEAEALQSEGEASTSAYGTSANPEGSLTVSGGTTIAQMNLIESNADALRAACVPAAEPPNPNQI